jgi:uracil-DNA glycosylase
MTRDRKLIAAEIGDHLKLYKDLGVRYARRDAPHAIDAPKNAAAVKKEPPAGLKTKTLAPAEPELFPPAEPHESETLEKIRADLGNCRRCKLAPLRTNIVFGTGDANAELMFVGEAPGGEEDAQGLPFVGRAGQLLTKIIASIELSRGDVYILNILKCRPPDNRNPESDEIAACEPFLFRQIAAIRPKVICALGLYAVQTLLRTKEPIGRLRGRFYEYRGVKLMPTFHPAYLLRNPNEKRKVWEDLRMVRDLIRSMRQQ